MKISQYTNLIKRKEYYIIHNPMYNTMIRIFSADLKKLCETLFNEKNYNAIRELESTDIEFLEKLKELNMIVPREYDEVHMLNYMKYIRQSRSRVLNLIIMPTMQCNFRCPYCYEEHVHSRMEDHTYDKIIKYIDTSIQTNGYKGIVVTWFGGEPTLEKDKIVEFMNRLNKIVPNDIQIFSHMTTNGYLLNFETFEKLVDNNVIDYQITLDGPKEFHDKTRYLKGGGGSWDVILSNLLSFKNSEKNFKVMIRTNFTEELFDHREEWFKLLKEKFGDDKRFVYHFETVKNLAGDNNEHVYDGNAKFDEESQKVAKENDLTEHFSKAIYPFSLECYAGNPENLVVYYDGTIKKCTAALDSEDNNIGRLLDDGTMDLDINNMARWTSYETNKKCFACDIYPICFGKKCPNVRYEESYCKSIRSLYRASIRNNY